MTLTLTKTTFMRCYRHPPSSSSSIVVLQLRPPTTSSIPANKINKIVSHTKKAKKRQKRQCAIDNPGHNKDFNHFRYYGSLNKVYYNLLFNGPEIAGSNLLYSTLFYSPLFSGSAPLRSASYTVSP